MWQLWAPSSAVAAPHHHDTYDTEGTLIDMTTTARTPLYRVTNRAGPGPAKILLYGDIEYGSTAARLMADLRAMSDRHIELHINSGGGHYLEAIACYNALRRHEGGVTVVVDSWAASAASLVAMAGARVLMEPGSSIMVHELQVADLHGSASFVAGVAASMDQWTSEAATIYARRAGGTVAQWRALMRAETVFSADEAVRAGLADAVLDGPGVLVSASARPGRHRIVYSAATRRRDRPAWMCNGWPPPMFTWPALIASRAETLELVYGAGNAIAGDRLIPGLRAALAARAVRFAMAGLQAGIIAAQVETGLVVRW